MFVLVSYDVSTSSAAGRRRLRQVAKICEDYGQRVQKSVFEIVADREHWTLCRHRLASAIHLKEDSLRFYFLGKNWRGRVEHLGIGSTVDFEGPLVV